MRWTPLGRLCRIALCALAPAGCVLSSSAFSPNPLRGGDFTGEVELRWENTDRYVYLPVDARPLTYTFPPNYRLSADDGLNGSADLRVIRPRLMYTDGGSIPRPLWGVSGFSPWDYLPAFVIHDWMYLQKRCHKAGKSVFDPRRDFPYDRVTVDKVLADTLEQIDRKLISQGKARPRNAAQARTLIVAAVEKFGKSSWERGDCELPPPELTKQVRVFAPQSRTMVERGKQVLRTVAVPATVEVPRYTFIRRFSAD